MDTSGFDPYEILGVGVLATTAEIHSAYRAAARRDHPDTNPDPEAAARFARATEAYELLTDDARRRGYDLARAAMHGPRAARSAPAPTGNTTVRGPTARPAHRPRSEDPSSSSREAPGDAAFVHLFVRIAIAFVVVMAVLLVLASLNPAPECTPSADPSFCRTPSPTVPTGGG
jgi:curved DNA-binding protein CbpA